MKPQDTTFLKGNNYKFIRDYGMNFVKIILLPCLLFYANSILHEIADEQKTIVSKQDALSEKISNIQLSFTELKISAAKDKELLAYRIQLLENRCDELYAEVYSKLPSKNRRTRYSNGVVDQTVSK